MTSPSGKAPHDAVLVAGPVRAPLHHISGHSHAKRDLLCGRVLYPVRVALLAAVYLDAAKRGLTMTFVASGMAIGAWWAVTPTHGTLNPQSRVDLTNG